MKKKILLFLTVLSVFFFSFALAACDTPDSSPNVPDSKPEVPDSKPVEYTVTAEKWDNAFSPDSLQNVAITIAQADTTQAMKYMFDASPAVMHMSQTNGGVSYDSYCEIADTGIWQYMQDESGKWSKTFVEGMTPDQSFYWNADFLGLYTDAVYDEAEHCYTVKDVELQNTFQRKGTLYAYFEDSRILKLFLDTDNADTDVLFTFTDYGTTKIDLPNVSSQQI